MNRTMNAVMGLVLLVVGVALFIYRTQGGAHLAEPLPVFVTVAAVVALLSGVGLLGRAMKDPKGR